MSEYGTIERSREGGAILSERLFAYPIERVRFAITEPKHLADWWLPFITEVRAELREGSSTAFD